ncbi:alkyl hydroperoxide reductase subunit F [Parabacteroides sp. FAFU027]|uniref:alkyl hydroperoxide reductase subunit F n=1 Tax=Parabacteroides sp. FAFU027 TaxID=2922715 RepID=UPI001FAFD643|nr:alkyl hydroperoxide reductase subunit F [Parabacteroides sp. FAFU027]
MLDQALQEQIKGLFAGLKSQYTFHITTGSTHSELEEMVSLMKEVAACSEQTEVKITEGDGLSLNIEKEGTPSSFLFRAVPNGHEFTSLLLAVLNMEGIGKNLPDEQLAARIKALPAGIHLKSYISLTCTNCPDVVQALNVLSILNPSIRHEIIDGSINQEEVEKLNIQAVPSVYANGELLHVGRSTLGELLGKLEEKFGTQYDASSSQVRQYDVLVAGGGPAGVSAAIYSARKGLKVAIVAEKVGGQVAETVGIENLISVPQTTGSQLVANMKLHLNDYPIDILDNRKIKEVNLVEGQKQLTTSLGEILSAPALIIATGASWRRLNVEGESQYIGSGVAFCAHCDGPFYKGKKVAVVGGGNSGLEAAIDLSAIASEVTVLEYLDELKGDQILQDKIATIPNISVHTGVQTQGIEGNGNKVTAIHYKNRSTETVQKLELDGVFVQIGLKANSDLFSHWVEVNRAGEIAIDAHCRTTIPGIYAAGDVSVVPYKQIVIAMGEGAKAALSAFEDKIKDKLV